MPSKNFTPDYRGPAIADAISRARACCQEAGVRFTPRRQRVLEILLSESRALGAYDVLKILREDGTCAGPPVAYRALEFLVKHGLAHKVERLNAFVACSCPGSSHTPTLLICGACKKVTETAMTPEPPAIAALAKEAGFTVDSTIVEALGLCTSCQKDTSA